jgi:hypothetical protein
MAASFFTSIPSFSDFSQISEEEHYVTAPAEWCVVVTDVVNSTEAVDSGQYRKVNIAGAAAIAAMKNLCKGTDIPFTFGGDGSSILIPPEQENAARQELMKVKAFCQSAFGLGLRVGLIKVAALQAKQAEVKVARYQVRDGVSLAAFKGGGIRLAEEMLKDGTCEITATGEGMPDTNGLSCRWEPLKPNKGKILALLVLAKEGHAALYPDIIGRIQAITSANKPISRGNLRFKWPPRGLMIEAKLTKGWALFNLLRLYAFTALVYWLTKKNKKAGEYDPEQYQRDVVLNADYKKFDDMLRMVLDCSEDEIRQIRDYLESLRAGGQLYFGMHVADHALMTCLVSSLHSDGHVHFIDGGDGGYAFAAKELKAQMKVA